MTLRLVPGSGPAIEITRDRVVVGRDPTCEVVVNDPSISRRHARLERRGELWTVVDEGSSNGTFVNSRRVSTAPVAHGQELRFGSAGFRVEISAAPAAAPPSATILEDEPLPAGPSRRPAPAAAPPTPPPRAPRATPSPTPGQDASRGRQAAPSRRGLPRWAVAGGVVLLVAGATAAALLLATGRPPAGTASAAAVAPAGTLPAGSLSVRTLGVGRAAGAPTVTLRMEISGFACRPEEDGFRIDLVVDLATLGPDGEPIPDLTHREFRRLSERLAAQERTASLTASITPPAGSRPGAHRARFTVHDRVAGAQVVHEVPFEHR